MVYLLTQEQKDAVYGNCYTDNSYFNPIQDANGNWIITYEEVSQCNNSDFVWVKDLPQIPYVPPKEESFPDS